MEIKHKIIEDRVEEIREITVYEFSMGDVEEPDLYASQPLYEWTQTERGQWVMKNACEVPVYHNITDFATMGYKYIVRAKFVGSALTEYLLKYGK